MVDKWKEYTTRNGDTWDSISYELFKNSKLFHYLISWNEEHSKYFVFPKGIKLKYKDIILESRDVPPWRRNEY